MATGESVADQKGKPTHRPTMRWVFQLFAGIHLLLIAGQAAAQLKPPQYQIITLLGPAYHALYT
ncbi:MAG: hypothetical protein U1F68_02505 [Gammaproteobacteria bacterium]